MLTKADSVKSRYREVRISKSVATGVPVGFESVRLFRKWPIIIIYLPHGTSVGKLEMKAISSCYCRDFSVEHQELSELCSRKFTGSINQLDSLDRKLRLQVG